MPATIVGLTSITFAGSAETVAVWTSFSQTTDADKTVVVDHDGDHVAIAYHGLKSTANLSGYLKSTVPNVGASISLANAISTMGGISGGTFYIDSVALSKAPNDFNQVTINATNHNF